MGEIRIPTVLAVGLWAASALAVLTYTTIAFKETSTDLEGVLAFGGNPLVAGATAMAAEEIAPPQKQLDRGHFKPSGKGIESFRGLFK